MPATHYQAGILDAPPEHALVAALQFLAPDSAGCQAALASLRELIRRELAADLDVIDPDSNPANPTADTGELGVASGYSTSNLTITLGVSASGFQRLGVPAAQWPQDLAAIDWAGFGDQPVNSNEGDLVLQICAGSPYIVEHVLRRVEHSLGASLAVVWTLLGEQRHRTTQDFPLSAEFARALIGFHDGLSNLDPKDPADQALIFASQDGATPPPPSPPAGQQPPPGPEQPGYGQPGGQGPSFPALRQPPASPEPAWAKDGSYLMVRGSVLNMAAWDADPLAQQQQAVGRWKYSGATLDNPNEVAHRRDQPAFAADPAVQTVPPTSHIRRANPRALPTDPLRRIFRRGFPLIAAQAGGTLQRGLLFIAFGRTLSTQAEFIMKAWLKNANFPEENSGVDPLLAQESAVLAGGFYFVPPVADPGERWNFQLPAGG